jgi:RNA polymerase sigma factor (sigma-70 family)
MMDRRVIQDRHYGERPMQRDLVIRASTGDHEAFSTLAADAFGRLFRTARLILRDDGLAADAVQDALLSAWLHIRAIRDPDRFEAWLRRLLIRACYREASRHHRRNVMEIDVTTLDPHGSDDTQQVTALRDQLERGFRRLDAAQRAVLVVHHYLDLADQDAADALDIPLGTYKSRLHRANAALRGAIEADERAAIMPRGSIA